MPQLYIPLSADELLSYAYRTGWIDAAGRETSHEDEWIEFIKQSPQYSQDVLEAVRLSYRAGYKDCPPDWVARS